MNNRNFLLLILLLLFILIRIYIYFQIPDNFDLDDSEPWSKINIALQWWQSENTFPDINFAPLHAYLIISGLKIWNNVFITPRIISLIFGIFLIFPFYALINKLFNEKVALISTVLLLFYPLHIRLSVISLAMAPFVFFLFLSFYWFFSYKDNKDLLHLVFSAIFLNFAGALRYEGWVFIPILLLFLLKEKKKDVSIFFIISMIFPSYWMYIHYKAAGHPLMFAIISAKTSKPGLLEEPLICRIFGWPYILGKTLTLPVGILSIIGLVISFAKSLRNNISNRIKRKYIQIGLILTMVFLIYEYKSITATFDFNRIRYSLPLGVMLIPYAGIAIVKTIDFYKRRLIKIILFFILFVTIISSSFDRLIYIIENSYAPCGIKASINWLNNNVKDEHIIILLENIEHPYIVVTSKLKLSQFVTPDYNLQGRIVIESLNQILKEQKPKYIIYSFRNSELHRIFNFSLTKFIQDYNGIKMRRVFYNEGIAIYEAKYLQK